MGSRFVCLFKKIQLGLTISVPFGLFLTFPDTFSGFPRRARKDEKNVRLDMTVCVLIFPGIAQKVSFPYY